MPQNVKPKPNDWVSTGEFDQHTGEEILVQQKVLDKEAAALKEERSNEIAVRFLLFGFTGVILFALGMLVISTIAEKYGWW